MSGLQRQNGKGYFAALSGGIGGIAIFLVTLFIVARGYFATVRSQPDSIPSPSFMIGVIVGMMGAEILGCWLVLRLGHYPKFRITAAWLTVLFVPGWIVYSGLNLILGTVLSAILLFTSLPLLARALTNHPNFTKGISRAMHTYTKRPFN